MSELLWGVKNGDLEQVKELVEKEKIDVNALVDGRILLVEASDYGQLEVIRYLVTDKKADVNATDPRGITPLLAAIYEGHTECVKMLLEMGAARDLRTPDQVKYEDAAEKQEIKALLR